jgi:hypothetical protein
VSDHFIILSFRFGVWFPICVIILQDPILLHCVRMLTFFTQDKQPILLLEKIDEMITSLITYFDEKDNEELLDSCFQSFTSLVNKFRQTTQMVDLYPVIRRSILSLKSRDGTGEKGEENIIAVFARPKALEILSDIFVSGMRVGSMERRELCATFIGEMLVLTPQKVLQKSVMKCIGPMIRMMSERLPENVKAAVFGVIGVAMGPGGPFLRAMIPQLQTTFVRSLNGESRQVAEAARDGLVGLIEYSPRPDAILKEITHSIQKEESRFRDVQYSAFRVVLENSMSRISPLMRTTCFEVASSDLGSTSAEVGREAAFIVANLMSFEEENAFLEHVSTFIESCDQPLISLRIVEGLASSERIASIVDSVTPLLTKHTRNLSPTIRVAALKAIAMTIRNSIPILESGEEIVEGVVANMSHDAEEIRSASLEVVAAQVEVTGGVVPIAHLLAFLPHIVRMSKDRVTPVKLRAEEVINILANTSRKTLEQCFSVMEDRGMNVRETKDVFRRVIKKR